MQPLYTPENTSAAFQLNWSVTLFGKVSFPPPSHWLHELKATTESDHVRILEFHAAQPNVAQFLVSTLPEQSPSEIVRSLKGRWQFLMKARHPKCFRRNYFIASVGEVNSQILDQYIAGQPSKHPMVNPALQAHLEALQFHDPAVDLGKTVTGNYGQFIYGLQLVVETSSGWNEVRENVLEQSRAMILRTAAKKRLRLSRIGFLSNHIHLLLGPQVTESPASVALSLMNNLAYVQGMKPIYRFSYYIGTFGRYDRSAIRRKFE